MYTKIECDSKLLSGFPWPINGNPYNNVESARTLEIPLILNKFMKIVGNEILHVESETHSAVIPFYKLMGRFKSEHSR
jgi:hypothetical protein